MVLLLRPTHTLPSLFILVLHYTTPRCSSLILLFLSYSPQPGSGLAPSPCLLLGTGLTLTHQPSGDSSHPRLGQIQLTSSTVSGPTTLLGVTWQPLGHIRTLLAGQGCREGRAQVVRTTASPSREVGDPSEHLKPAQQEPLRLTGWLGSWAGLRIMPLSYGSWCCCGPTNHQDGQVGTGSSSSAAHAQPNLA
jgi:hypothetical protein